MTTGVVSRVLRVLIVEDSENDAILLSLALQSGGYDIVTRRVWTAEMMRFALSGEEWDLVCSDHAMPQFNAREALALCKQMSVDVPFIIVSGRIGEDVAVELMKAGAHDYVRKDDFSRLVPAVSRELESARDRAVRRRTEAAMVHLAAIVRNCSDAIISASLDGTILSWNRGADQTYGYQEHEIVGHSISLLLPPGPFSDIKNVTERIARGESIECFETIGLRKDGQPVDISITVSPVRNLAGELVGASVIARDITQRKKDEDDRIRLISELTQALAQVKALSGLLPICASCKKIRNDNGYWEQVEFYIQSRSNAEFTHGICPDCGDRLYGDFRKTPMKAQG